jgi:hypothetical protein
MNDSVGGKGIAPDEGVGNTARHYQRDFWIKENQNLSSRITGL